MKPTFSAAVVVALSVGILACDTAPSALEVGDDPDLLAAKQGPTVMDPGPYTFAPPVFDISAAPDGSLLVAEFTTIMEIRKGEVSPVSTVPTAAGSAVNGLAALGRGSFFATSAGQDLAFGAGLWHVTPGGARLVADIEAFETVADPDAFEGETWKAPICETLAGFSAGPQSNPYHVAVLQGGKALVADAAGNTLLRASVNGDVDWVAVFTPPTDGNGDWQVTGAVDGTTCYAQPVPTSVAVAPNGDILVGELTGVTPDDFVLGSSGGYSRVWRIEAGAEHVVCPSSACTLALEGFTSIIDLAFGPDGDLYVLEYDENGWFAATVLGNPAGGTLNRCDLDAGSCMAVAEGLTLPGAITFDKWGNLWLLESNIVDPTVRMIDLA